MDAAGGGDGEITSMVNGGLLVANSRNIGWLLAYVGVGSLGYAMVPLLSWLLAPVLY